MVVGALNHHICGFWNIDIYNQWFCLGAIYIHIILMNREKALETIIVLALVLLIVHLQFHVSWAVYLAVGLLAIAVISKKITLFIGKLWFAFSHYLGLVMNQIIMFIIFYLFLLPLSFFQRLMGNNQILKKHKDNSYFHQRHHLFTKKDIERPW